MDLFLESVKNCPFCNEELYFEKHGQFLCKNHLGNEFFINAHNDKTRFSMLIRLPRHCVVWIGNMTYVYYSNVRVDFNFYLPLKSIPELESKIGKLLLFS